MGVGTPKLKAPFPWFGGKSRVAHIVWERFGELDNYVEPFFGSGAVLLGSPRIHRYETVNDADGFVCNFWRAVAADPEQVAKYADWPVNENDLYARHAWLAPRRAELTARLEGDPDYFDAKIAGWWVWGISCWIGDGWCDVVPHRKRPHLSDAGQGVNQRAMAELAHAMRRLAERMRRVRVCCGDWIRIVSGSIVHRKGRAGRRIGVFLDPPYAHVTGRTEKLYGVEMPDTANVREWCVERQDDPDMRIALCGYDGEYDLPAWECVAWKARGGYAGQSRKHDNPNAKRERIWFSPSCVKPQRTLFDAMV